MGLSVITASDCFHWNEIVKSYGKWDIYYLAEYALSFQLHGDGTPLLLHYKDENDDFCYVVMKRDIAEDPLFSGVLERQRYYDFETPYGYGGPLTNDGISSMGQKKFLKELGQYTKENQIISQFVRFHPLLANHITAPEVFDTRYLHKTVYIDTSSEELIMKNMDSKNRNMVRKAIKNDVFIIRKDIGEYKDFIPIYEETMDKDSAAEYYYFSEEYFREQQKLKNNACFFYAIKDNIPIAGAIMYYNEQFMHYHLAGSHSEYRKYSPGNLLLYEAACWASKEGIKQFHLGGGIVEDDNLFGFKKQFNKNGYLPFYIGRTIFDSEGYSLLMEKRKTIDPSFDFNNNRMIQYRA